MVTPWLPDAVRFFDIVKYDHADEVFIPIASVRWNIRRSNWDAFVGKVMISGFSSITAAQAAADEILKIL